MVRYILGRRALILAGFLLPAAIIWAQPLRITRPIQTSSLLLPRNLSPKVQNGVDKGRVPDSFPLQYVSLLVQPTAAQKSELARLLARQQDPLSPDYHRWLTPAQYADRFGLNPADMARLVAWLEAEGFTVNYQANARNWIAFSGDAAHIRNTFRTEIHEFEIDSEKHFANATAPSIPPALAGIVSGLRGLDDFRLKPAYKKGRSVARESIRPQYTDPGGSLHFLAPDDLATIYDFNTLHQQGFNGGAFVVVVGQSSYYISDLSQYCYAFGLPGPFVLNYLYGPDPGITPDYVEAELDMELMAAAAPDSYIYYIYVTDVFSAAQAAIDKDFAPVVSMSYGGCEQDNQSILDFGESLAQEANSFGITWLAASGDSGAAGCDSSYSSSATRGLAVSFPASIPEVTAVGGTEFNDGTGNFWSTSNGPNFGSALSYIPELPWNDSSYGTGLDPTLAAAGGGLSTSFAVPWWQAGLGIPNLAMRGVPDISLSASAAHDGYLVCIQPDCPYYFDIFGGTSASTPVMAGIVFLLNEYVTSKGLQPTGPVLNGLGNINPVLYSLRTSNPEAFHDVTAGSNSVPCLSGSPNCTAGHLGYAAASGYDLATGLGSVDAANLFTAWVNSATPYLRVTLTHPHNFVQGQIGAVYTATVLNTGTQPSTGTIFVESDPVTYLSVMGMSGPGWNCSAPVSTNACLYASSIPPGGSSTPLTFTYGIPLNAPPQVVNQVSMWGGNATPTTASDPTTILPYTLYSISGQVTLGGVPLAGVTVKLTGDNYFLAVTDGSGRYSFSLVPGGNYIVIPSLASYAFSPPSQTFPYLAVNQTADFSAACLFSVGPVSSYLDAASQPAPTLGITTGSNCGWTASAAGGFINITSSSSGVGSGTLTSEVAANDTGAVRNGSITVAGQTAALTQRATARVFTDVNPPDYFFDFADVMSADHITGGCSVTPPEYCPSSTTTRSQMAVFIITAIEGGNPFTYTTTPYFADVSPSNPYFKFIQKMRDLGITSGCTSTNYCPDSPVTRGQMAVFIIVARYGAIKFAYPSTPYFSDVTPSSSYFPFVQKMAQEGITAGCGNGKYCPSDSLTRGQLSVFIVTGLRNQLLSPGTSVIRQISPVTGSAGQSLALTVVGSNTHFAQGATQIAVPPGITVSNIMVTDPSTLTAQFTISPTALSSTGAANGSPYSIVVTTGTEEADLPNGFFVQ